MPDVTLGAVGREQARGLAARFGREEVAAVYSSPLERARETAAPIATALGQAVRTAPDLIEIDFGEWTGLAFDDLRRDERWHVWNRDREAGGPPGGETMRATQDRAAIAVEHFLADHPDGTVVAVSHSDVIKAVVCRQLGLSLDRYGAFEIGPASVTSLVLWPGGGKVLSLNVGAAA